MTTTDRLRDALEEVYLSMLRLPYNDSRARILAALAAAEASPINVNGFSADAGGTAEIVFSRAALATRSDEGWRYVPVEATREMEAAAKAFSLTRAYSFEAFCGMYTAMLAAAPSPPDREAPSP